MKDDQHYVPSLLLLSWDADGARDIPGEMAEMVSHMFDMHGNQPLRQESPDSVLQAAKQNPRLSNTPPYDERH